jgi:leader peptidase (prepilin peptidase)/N-methyltransferase
VEPFPAVALAVTMVASAVTDLAGRRIPNLLTGGAAGVAILLAGFGLSIGLVESLAVAVIVGIPLAALAILRPDGFGMGDAKLIGVMALFMGWAVWVPLVTGLGLATLVGIGIGLVRCSRSTDSFGLPLAPFLAASTVPFLAVSVPMLH